MMKQRVFAAAVLGFAVWFSATPAQALGCKLFGKKDCSPCAAAAVGCAAPCAPAPCAAPCGPVVAAPTFTTQVVAKPVVTKQKVTTTTYAWVDEPFEYTVVKCVPTTKKQMVDVSSYVMVDEPYTAMVCKPVTTMVAKPVTKTVCVPTQVSYTVPVTTRVCVPVCSVDRCGCPTTSYRSERVTTCETRCKTVMTPTCVTEMVNCARSEERRGGKEC